VVLEEGGAEALERGADMGVRRRVVAEEEPLEGAPPREDALAGQAQGEHVALAVETVAEAREAWPLLLEIEAAHEGRGRVAHALERPVDPRAEQVDAAIGHAGGEQGRALALGG